jgi:anti-anti-sigma regulatory factor
VEAPFQASDLSQQSQLPSEKKLTAGDNFGCDDSNDVTEFDQVDRPCALILHMNDVVGCDASGMDSFSQIVRLCQSKNCQLHLAAVSDKDIILLQKSGLLLSKVVTVSKSLDDALKSSE